MRSSDDQAETIALLSRPETWGLIGGLIGGPVERIDTHAAIVFLAGDRACKLKRAVRLPYLDFSTPARRRAVCMAELELNRRTAPDLYLGVLPVGRRADGTLALDQGEPVDWVVMMRRFPADALLETMAASGSLPPLLVRDLADAVAAFHATAGIVAGPGAVPGADRVRAVIDGNRTSMSALPDGLLDPASCATLHRRSLARLGELAPLLDRRARSGQVRHCHGDLHLANICLWQGRPTLFDGLEFDPQLATTDVLYDLAFLLMDLWQRGLHPEASALFNRYCDMTDCDDGLATLPLFLSMRAAVRAHVGASAAATQADAAARTRKLSAARHYLEAALALLSPSRPRLIAIGGLSGTGKSTLAGGLAPGIGAAPGARWLRSDVLRKRLAGLPPETRLPGSAYAPDRTRAVYAELASHAGAALAAGHAVIVDAVFADAAEREAIAQVAAAADVPFNGLWLEAPHATMRSRVARRQGDASDADVAVVDRQQGHAVGDTGAWHRVDASGDPAAVLAGARVVLG